MEDEEENIMSNYEIESDKSEADSEFNGSESEIEIENDDSFKVNLIELENRISTNLRKISAYDYLRYRALHLFFDGWINKKLK
jgi:hypothetical protein